jgi:methionine synthase II (cobalamin-independent)
MTVYTTVDRITAPTGLGIVEEFRFARGRTDRPLKVTCPGPLTLTTSLKLAAPYKDPLEAVEDLSQIIRSLPAPATSRPRMKPSPAVSTASATSGATPSPRSTKRSTT